MSVLRCLCCYFVPLTLPGVLISFVVDKISDTAAIMQPLLVIEGLERLAGAVGLLGRHATLVCIQGGGVELGVFGAATPGQGAVPTILQIHAGVEVKDANRWKWRRWRWGEMGRPPSRPL